MNKNYFLEEQNRLMSDFDKKVKAVEQLNERINKNQAKLDINYIKTYIEYFKASNAMVKLNLDSANYYIETANFILDSLNKSKDKDDAKILEALINKLIKANAKYNNLYEKDLNNLRAVENALQEYKASKLSLQPVPFEALISVLMIAIENGSNLAVEINEMDKGEMVNLFQQILAWTDHRIVKKHFEGIIFNDDSLNPND